MAFSPMEFNPSPHHTVGIEWEIALTDPETRDLTPAASAVMKALDASFPNHRIVGEFLNNTVEMVTGIHTSLPDAIEDLRESLTQLYTVTDTLNVVPFSAGTHPFAHWADQELMPKEAYSEIIERTQWWGRQMLIWGIHVHVGIKDQDRVWPIINALMTVYPHILALSASSPAWLGTDTGYASNRTMLYQQLPTAGIPYQFHTWEQWNDFNRDQQLSGVTNHTGTMHFDVRPTKYGTVEIRFSDATMSVQEVASLAAFMYCLVVYFDTLYDQDPSSLPILQPWHVAENKWRAARYGLDALIITDRDTSEVLVTEDIQRWLCLLKPIAESLQCSQELAAVQDIIANGADYQRQRAIALHEGSRGVPGTTVRTSDAKQLGHDFSFPEAWIPVVDNITSTLRKSLGEKSL